MFVFIFNYLNKTEDPITGLLVPVSFFVAASSLDDALSALARHCRDTRSWSGDPSDYAIMIDRKDITCVVPMQVSNRINDKP